MKVVSKKMIVVLQRKTLRNDRLGRCRPSKPELADEEVSREDGTRRA
jgi:hypothetical protein